MDYVEKMKNWYLKIPVPKNQSFLELNNQLYEWAKITPSNNWICGRYAGYLLTTGKNNFIMGDYSGTDLTTGCGNILFGDSIDCSHDASDSVVLQMQYDRYEYFYKNIIKGIT